jgi:CheY-like chemotaxis protein
MTDEILSFRVVLVSALAHDRNLLQQAAASSAAIPVEVVAVSAVAEAIAELRAGADLLYIDSLLDPAEIRQALAVARLGRKPPFTVLLDAHGDGSEGFETDALAEKPAQLDGARRLIERSIRVRLPSRALVVDDSPTMRSIVRKLLASTRFPLDVSEAHEGFAALKRVREEAIDLVFVDFNMPGFSGLETISELRRERRRVHVVLMTSMADDSLPDRAREQGVAFLKKPFYPADIEAVLCRFYGLRALNPKRA